MNKNYEKNTSILIVEDELLLALGLENSLTTYGYKVCEIKNNANDAINYCNEHNPDLVLIDINLKGYKTGIEAANQIWQTKKIPIIFLTSYCDEKTINKSMECEPYGYLIKPYKDEELYATIKMALHKHNYFFKNKKTFEDNIIKITESISFDKGKNILLIDDFEQKLTGNEVKLLQILSDNLGQTVSFDRICTYIWREDIYDLGRLRTLVYRLKQKINMEIVENIFESGYKLKYV